MLYEQAKYKLNEILTVENINQSISNYHKKVNEPVKDNTDKTKWYYLSYPRILQRYKETSGLINQESWVERVALLSSWLPSIVNPALDMQAIDDMVFLERIFSDLKLEEIGVESYLGAVDTKYHGEMIFDTSSGKPPVLLKTFIENAGNITNISGRWEGTLSTTTKLLHFMFPHLFPIFDRRINEALFGGLQNYAKYHTYTFQLRELLQTNNESTKLIASIAEEMNISQIRVVDIVLFNIY